MHRAQLPPSSSRAAPPRLGAWAISKPSTNRISPYNRREISQLLKATAKLERDRTSRYGITTKSTDEDDGASNQVRDGYALRRKSSRILSTIKARLEKDSQAFHTKMKEMEPAIKSLTMAQVQASPRLRNSTVLSRRFNSTVSSTVNPSKMLGKDQVAFPAPPKLGGQAEKLVTIGGYIVSLHNTNENISTVLKPRISSDKDGLELEIRITGCDPCYIKFEKRYDTLIIIGVNKSAIRKLEESKDDGKASNDRDLSPFKSLREFSQHGYGGIPYSFEEEYQEEMHEVINIFVPKSVLLNQIFISKPDPRGKIYVKGP